MAAPLKKGAAAAGAAARARRACAAAPRRGTTAPGRGDGKRKSNRGDQATGFFTGRGVLSIDFDGKERQRRGALRIFSTSACRTRWTYPTVRPVQLITFSTSARAPRVDDQAAALRAAR